MMTLKEAGCWALVLAGAATLSVQISEHVKAEKDRIADLRAEIAAEEMRIQQLQAEWHGLTSPAHLSRMAQLAGVEMTPVVTHQYGGFNQMPEALEAGPHDFAGGLPLPVSVDHPSVMMAAVPQDASPLDAPLIAFAAEEEAKPIAPRAAPPQQSMPDYAADAFEAMIGEALSNDSFVTGSVDPKTEATPFEVAGQMQSGVR
ncbi:MAG: hypothetical protein Alpg2KO_23610 [Alphaproteobacteria bacterium]